MQSKQPIHSSSSPARTASAGALFAGAALAAALATSQVAAQDRPEAPTGTAGQAAPAGGAVDKSTVELDVTNVSLSELLRYFAQYYDLNITAPPNADQIKVPSVRFKGVPVMEALSSIVKPYGYVVVKSGSIIEIVRREDAAPKKSYDSPSGTTLTGVELKDTEIRMFEVKHARGEDLEKLVQGFLTPKYGYITFDAKGGRLLVRDIPEVLAKVAKVIEQVDVAPAEGGAQGTLQQPATIKVVRLRYVETAALKKVIEKIAKAENVDFEEEPTTKAFVLRGFPERIAAVERMIQTLDQKTAQVRIRVRIVETALGDSERLGINWNARLRTNGSARPWSFPFEAHTVDSWTFYPTPNPSSQVGGGGGGGGGQQLAGYATDPATGRLLESVPQVLSSAFTFGVLDASQFSALIEAIATDTSSNLVAAPQLTTMDNRPAEIQLGSTLPVPIFTNLLNQQTGTTFPTITGFTDIETGTILRVTPRVGGDGYITLDVAPEISEITGFVGQNQERPIRSQRKMKTTVVLKSGNTLALGGLNQTRKNETISKVPILGDIPLLGLLFTHKVEELTKTDLLIFITPELVADEESAPSEAAVETKVETKAAERGLIRIGEKWAPASAVDGVNRAARRLESPSPETRRAGVIEIAGLEEAERHEILKRADVLASVLKLDANVDVKRVAAEALGAVDPARLAAELATLPGNTPVQAVGEVLVPMAVRSPSRSVRQLILANAIKVDRASTVTALMAAVAFGQPHERVVGAEGLALAADVAAVNVLADAVREGKPGVAQAAVDALGACGGPQAVAALIGFLTAKPEPHMEMHLYAALAESIGDDAKLSKELVACGVAVSPRVRELAALEQRGRRPRFDRPLKAYATPAAGAPEITGPAPLAARVGDALKILAQGSPGHRHLVAVTLRGIDVVAAPKEGAERAPAERIDGGRLKLSAAMVEATPPVHLAHALVYYAAIVDTTAPPLDGGGAPNGGAAASVPVGHRVEEIALREQYLAIQAIAGRTDFREVSGVDASVEEALRARGLNAAPAAGQRR